MTHRDTPWPTGTPCWVDIAVPDVEAGTAFYAEIMGWSFVDSGARFGHYHLALTDGRAAAAISPTQQEGQPSVWTTYLATDDVDRTVELITRHGGSLLFEPVDIPDHGRMTVALDPTGGAFGIWQAGGMNGFAIANEPGSVTWNDARLTDVDAGRRFYSAVFGHTFEPVPDAPDGYATVLLNGAPVAGLVGTPEGVPSHWLTYFSVADVDASMAAAGRAGATVLMAAEDTDFGRIGILTDPWGATFALHEGLSD